MKIGIDLSFFGEGKSGIDKYAYDILKYISETDTENTYYLYTNNKLPQELNLGENFIQKKISPHFMKMFLFSLQKQLVKDEVDLFFGLANFLPKKNKHYKLAVIIHDLVIIKSRETTNFSKVKYILSKYLYKRSCRNADIIFANSESTKRDIVECFKIDPNKIKVIYLGNFDYRPKPISNEDVHSTLNKFKINKKYILSVGTIEPRKNLINTIKAFELYKQDSKSDIKYVIAGRLGWKYEPILKAINESKYKDDILYLDYISQKEKEILYRNALYTSFISLYEGFGYPIIESMVVGTPVLTSNVSSLPEVGGDVSYYVNDPKDIFEIKSQMEKLLEDIESNKIDKEKLLEQANKFKANDTGEKTVNCIFQLLQKGN